MKHTQVPKIHVFFTSLAGVVLFFGFTAQASAYAGLGPLVPMIGNWMILGFMFLLTMLGSIAYPIRMALRKFLKRSKTVPSVPAN